jgi:hypothetical protein
MHSPHISRLMAQSRAEDLRRAGARPRSGAGGRIPVRIEPHLSLTLRFGFPDDAEPLGRLAALDSSTPPPHPVLLAEVDGELRAALSLADGHVIADPFQPTEPLVALLRTRAQQLGGDPDGPSRGRARAWLRLGLPAWR